MCGRDELSSHPAAIALAFGLTQVPDLAPHYNIAPTQRVPIVRLDDSGARELVQVKWGLVPRWAKDPSIGGRLYNARGETVAQKAAFRAAYARHRCLVPANGFYEWQVRPGGKQPLHIGMSDDAPFGMAGLFERWRASAGEVLDTCTIITTDANEALRPIHDRMPVIVPPASYSRWLDATNPDVADLLVPWSGPALSVYAVSTRVNRAENDDAGVREPIQASLL